MRILLKLFAHHNQAVHAFTKATGVKFSKRLEVIRDDGVHELYKSVGASGVTYLQGLMFDDVEFCSPDIPREVMVFAEHRKLGRTPEAPARVAWRQQLSAHLRSLLDAQRGNPLWLENSFGAGCTETGFESTFELDYDALSEEIDKFCASFKEKQ